MSLQLYKCLALVEDLLAKAKAHKYIKRIPLGRKNNRMRYRYIYPREGSRHGKARVHHHETTHEDIKEGASFSAGKQNGHWIVDSTSGDQVTYYHDDAPDKGKRVTVSKKEFHKMLTGAHEEDVARHAKELVEKLKDTEKKAKEHAGEGSKTHKAAQKKLNAHREKYKKHLSNHGLSHEQAENLLKIKEGHHTTVARKSSTKTKGRGNNEPLNPLDLKEGKFYMFTPEDKSKKPFKVKFTGATRNYLNRREMYNFEDGKDWHIELTNYKVAEKVSNLTTQGGDFVSTELKHTPFSEIAKEMTKKAKLITSGRRSSTEYAKSVLEKAEKAIKKYKGDFGQEWVDARLKELKNTDVKSVASKVKEKAQKIVDRENIPVGTGDKYSPLMIDGEVVPFAKVHKENGKIYVSGVHTGHKVIEPSGNPPIPKSKPRNASTLVNKEITKIFSRVKALESSSDSSKFHHWASIPVDTDSLHALHSHPESGKGHGKVKDKLNPSSKEDPMASGTAKSLSKDAFKVYMVDSTARG
mgnify:CR=1 FL=1